MTPIAIWAQRHGVSTAALAELAAIVGARTEPTATPNAMGEARVQSLVRLQAARQGIRLWRNNVGVLKDINGRPVRYGLANDSEALNKTIKSSDLIGWRRIVITVEMVGSVIAQFVARECKEPDWAYCGDNPNPTDKVLRERAQKRWLDMVTLDGGDAAFTTGD